MILLQGYSQDTHAKRGNVKMLWRHFHQSSLQIKKKMTKQLPQRDTENERQRELSIYFPFLPQYAHLWFSCSNAVYPLLMNFHLTFVISIYMWILHFVFVFFLLFCDSSRFQVGLVLAFHNNCFGFTLIWVFLEKLIYQYTWQSGVISFWTILSLSLQVPYTLLDSYDKPCLISHFFLSLSNFFHLSLCTLIWFFSLGKKTMPKLYDFPLEPTTATLIITPLSIPIHAF